MLDVKVSPVLCIFPGMNDSLNVSVEMDIEFVFRIGKPIHHGNYKIIETISMNCAAYTVIPRMQVRHA